MTSTQTLTEPAVRDTAGPANSDAQTVESGPATAPAPAPVRRRDLRREAARSDAGRGASGSGRAKPGGARRRRARPEPLPRSRTTSVGLTRPWKVRPIRFVRVLRAEWIKLWTVRSTWVTTLLTLALMIGMAVLMAQAIGSMEGPSGRAIDPKTGMTLTADSRLPGVTVVSLGYMFAQLTVAVMSVLVMTGELSTRMMRTTFAAAPRRFSVMVAKTLVVLVVTVTVSYAGLIGAYFATEDMLTGASAVDLSQTVQQRALVGVGLYLACVCVLSVGIGGLITHTAGAICVVVGVLMVLPTVFQIVTLSSDAAWVHDIYTYLPSVAGEQVILQGVKPPAEGEPAGLRAREGIAVFAGYAAAVWALAAVTLKVRDA
ncbi:ABC transporter permease subunit [Brevibacterium samyangense]|uniref:ABC transporter permease subunit n=1 Tax=Brevibacterium samyangense TaxID=366888 RepID=UPI0031E474A0